MKKVPFKVLENLHKIIFQSFITVIAENWTIVENVDLLYKTYKEFGN